MAAPVETPPAPAAAPPRVVVCTFATKDYLGSAALLRHTALREGGADAVVVYTEDDVQDWFQQYPELLEGSRGYGWWTWKPWVILHALRNSLPNDVVVYLDAATMVERPLAPYAQRVRHALLFRLGEWDAKDYRNRCWTKRDAFALMGLTEDRHRDGIQVNAAVQMYRNTPQAHDFVTQWLRWCAQRNVVDDACSLANEPSFVAHRHDQSVLSVLAVDAAAAGVVDVARDPTQFGIADPTLQPLVDVSRQPLVNHHRQRRRPARVAVVTPTTGGRHLAACMRSVQEQDLPNVHHYVVVDGPRHEAAARAVAATYRYRNPVHVLVLPHNVGAGGWNGHRVYGALPWLVDADYVAYLDDDNEFDPDHLRVLLRTVVNARASWGYSLRRIIDQDSEDVCPDNCESLGGICPTVLGGEDRLIDTSCYLLERELAVEASTVWNARFRDPSRPEPDRQLAKVLLASAPHVCVRRHSVRYRVGNTAQSVRADFFVQGNERTGFDPAKADLYVFHFSPEATRRFLDSRRRGDRSYALDEWQMTLLRGLDPAFNLLDGYACAPNLPPGALVYVSMCQPDQVPWDLLAARTDCWRVGYTLESPNIRHAAQWDPRLLGKHFDRVLTYWAPLLRHPDVRAVFAPHNTHHLDFANPLDAALLRPNRGRGASVAMVLERRPQLRGTYAVPGVPGAELECLDPLRELLVKDLTRATVFGTNWDDFVRQHPRLTLGHALHRSADPRHSTDILGGYSFALIVENTDAEGYISEKLYDALMAGCVPLYYGSDPPPGLRIPAFDAGLGGDGARLGGEGVYVDLKRLLTGPRDGWSAQLQAWLDGLSDEAVEAAKARVAALREAVLRQVDVPSFAAAVERALADRPV